MPAKAPPFIRLYRNMIKRENGCWEWQGANGSSGYGQIKAFGKMVITHRLSYELYHGPIPLGLEVMHSCDNRSCINPDHLSCGTHQQNMIDMAARGHKRNGKPNPRKGAESSQATQVKVLGKVYGSLKEAERALALGSGTVRYWIKNHPTKAAVISKQEYQEKLNGISE